MKVSAKTDYACKAILELSLNWPHVEPLQIGVIAERQNIPLQFLTQILINLKQLGYTESIRGKKGGYRLAVAPKDITLGQLVQCLEQTSIPPVKNINQPNQETMADIWNEVDEAVLKLMDKISFENIVDRKRKSDNTIMFEI